MRFVCLVHVDPELMGKLSPDELARMDRDNEAFDAGLIASGHYVTALALDPPVAAQLVRRRDGRVSVTDGPYAETKEQLGGFVLIEAESLEAALEIARRDPMASFGTIEVRPEMGIAWQKAQQGR